MKIKVKSVKESRKLRNKQKEEKGITLVALIITVVVMLILAGVAISAIVGGEGLFSKVRETVSIYENAQQKEQEEISNLINEIENYNTVYIYTKEDLEKFRDSVDNGNNYKGKTVMLMNDIDLGGDENDESTWWNPIGYSSQDASETKRPFSGVFEGNNYIIEGIYNKVEEGTQTVGFFSHIYGATINNLTISGDIILGANIDDTNLAGGGLVGGVGGGNCLISNCINKVNVTKLSTYRDAAGFVGAIGGNGNLTIKNCVNYGNITGSNNCGGIVGNVDNGSVIIENTCNKGAITNYLGNYTGGFIGRDGDGSKKNSIVINNSYNEGIIKARGNTGGLVARAYGDISINNSYNNAEIYNEKRTTSGVCIGGLIGLIMETSPNCVVTNSYNNSNINIEEGDFSTNVGGLLGGTRAINAYIINCYNIGNISNGAYVSGICGAIYAPSGTSPILNIKNTYNIGSVSGKNTRGIMIISNLPTTVNAEKVYLLDTVSDVGISNLDTANPIEIPVESLSEENMKSEEFVNELNTNLSSIDTEYDLSKWKYVNGSYPVFE